MTQKSFNLYDSLDTARIPKSKQVVFPGGVIPGAFVGQIFPKSKWFTTLLSLLLNVFTRSFILTELST